MVVQRLVARVVQGKCWRFLEAIFVGQVVAAMIVFTVIRGIAEGLRFGGGSYIDWSTLRIVDPEAVSQLARLVNTIEVGVWWSNRQSQVRDKALPPPSVVVVSCSRRTELALAVRARPAIPRRCFRWRCSSCCSTSSNASDSTSVCRC